MMTSYRGSVLSAFLLAAVLVALETSAAIPVGKKVIGYLPDYRLSELAKINLGNVTHVVYSSIDADVNGNLMIASGLGAGLPSVVGAVHGAGKKVTLCVGGWLTDGYFHAISASPAARANFISQLVSYCRNNKLDGVDLDWEPVADGDVPAYTILIQELHTALAPYGLLLSVAVSSKHYDILASAAASLDWVSVMAYDMNWAHADHSSYVDAVASMTFWAQSGIEPAKLVMGVPFFGLNEGWVTALTYAEIVDTYNPGPDVNNVGGFGFNGATLIKAKTAYALSSGFGGMMIWELGQDKFDSRSLLTVLATAMGQDVVPIPVLPAPWVSSDVGPVGLIGSASQSNGVFTVAGAGADIGGRSDAFRYVYQSLSGDGSIVARVPSQTGTSSSAKAGVMIRETLNSNSRFVFMDVTVAKTYGLLIRTSTGGKASSYSGGTMATAPNNWVRLVRVGNTLTAYKSSDGVKWTLVKSCSLTMAPTIYIGLAVTSRSTTSLSTARFDNMTVVP